MFFKKKQTLPGYDRAGQQPAIRSSICTGERTAGFRDIQTGKFTEVMLLRAPEDLEEFRRLYHLGSEDIPIIY